MKVISRRRQLQSAESLDTGQTWRGVLIVKSRTEIRFHLGEPIRISKVGTEEWGNRQSPLTVIDHFHLSVLFDGEHGPICFGAEIDAIVPIGEDFSGIRKAQQRLRRPLPAIPTINLD